MPKILIAPLDWGLGHATRCIPIIRCFEQEGWEVSLAADGYCAKILRSAFPNLPLLMLPGYHIRYGVKNLPIQILAQIPAIYAKIRFENRWLKDQMHQNKWDVILSDNRPGLHHPKALNIYMTHQVHIESGLGIMANYTASAIHQQLIKKFDALWIPDVEKNNTLAGKLSRSSLKKTATAYIGLLSRLEKTETKSSLYNLLLLLSGPEPQRTMLENQLLSQIDEKCGKTLLIRGTELPIAANQAVPENIEVINLADSKTVNQKIQESEYVICRSGYTTLMDLMKLNKKALLIPTPNQGEQEYLAAFANNHNFFPFISQKQVDIVKALKKMQQFPYAFPFTQQDFQQHQQIIRNLKNKIC